MSRRSFAGEVCCRYWHDGLGEALRLHGLQPWCLLRFLDVCGDREMIEWMGTMYLMYILTCWNDCWLIFDLFNMSQRPRDRFELPAQSNPQMGSIASTGKYHAVITQDSPLSSCSSLRRSCMSILNNSLCVGPMADCRTCKATRHNGYTAAIETRRCICCIQRAS